MSASVLNIWREFEEWFEPPTQQRDFFNMKMRLADGTEYTLNVLTFDYAQRIKNELYEERSLPVFVLGPDVSVDIADQPTLEALAERLVQVQSLRAHWLVSRRIPQSG